MLGSPFRRRAATVRRGRRLWAAALCAASFLAGQALLGVEPPTPDLILNQYRAAKSALAPVAAPASGMPQRAFPTAQASGLPQNALPPAGQRRATAGAADNAAPGAVALRPMCR